MPTHAKSSRIGMSRNVLRALLGAAAIGALCTSGDANAQIAGSTARPLPNVLLLVDTSGSMERMVDNSLPAQNRDPVSGLTIATPPLNACAPGTASNPNRWGMLLQALTGNMQPYYSCDVVDRTSAAFKNEFKIAGKPVYDADYFLPYHRPLSGATAPTACTFAPYTLPGVANGSGIGPSGRGSGATTDVRDLPPDAFTEVLNAHLASQYASNSGLVLPTNACTFEQAADGQLDAARDYVRFGLMTFDNDPSPGTGVSIPIPPSGNVDTVNPFTGQWSYAKSPTNTFASSTGTALAVGLPAGCITPPSPFEVGARHSGAPPWEGRMVPFPPANGDTYDIEATNDAIQKVLLGTRPYGATPIEGMMEDARDYFLFNPQGPNGTTPDPYVAVGCRDQYIILLTDGAPNLDLRPSCEGPGGRCPFNKAATIADSLSSSGAVNKKVNTYVIGFSVNGSGDVKFTNDGFPTAPLATSCKQWYTNLGGTPAAMRAACTAPATTPPKESTAAACCELNEIAYWGTAAHDVGPFFAETQADLVLSFGRVLGGVAKSATTRTLPGYAPAVTVSGINRTGSFIASFIPNAQKVWSGEIDRERSFCAGAVPTPQPQSVIEGDSYSANLAAQAVAGNRRFISVTAQTTAGPASVGNVVDSARTIRPYAAATPVDGIPQFVGTEVSAKDDGLKGSANWPEAMDIQINDASGHSPTCKRSRGVEPITRASIDIPPLSRTDCTTVMWDFATAHYGSVKPSSSPWEFNVRCSQVGNLSAGFCSVSGGGCTVADPNACAPPAGVPGEVCVPNCSALGAIYRSSPVLVGTPNQFLRDDAYQAFAATRINRRPTMYVASADGVLHAFKALASTSFDNGDFEMWAFVPPAVLPKIATNYPTGQQILLDGTPAVKDTVWERKPGDPVSSNTYHTTLVAGMGAGGGGYYALNVSDPDCGGYPAAATGCIASFTAATTKAQAFGTAAIPAVGPHFLWQLTDVEWIAGDPAKQNRKSRDNVQHVALFGAQSGTPAITTLQVDPDGTGVRQLGVAILPGGIDGPPVKGGTCPRGIDGGGPYAAANFDFSDPAFPRRSTVRQWGTACIGQPVPGRGVTVVRLDTGEIIRHFGRAAQDVPKRINDKGVVIDTPFDSPIIGTPVVYPNIVGATAQKAFVGDADGTVWRIDLSSSDPAQWRATLFQDLVNTGLSPSCGSAAQCAVASQPITTPPVLSLDPSGGIVINVATGDQENLVVSNDVNYAFSVQEARPTAVGTPSRATVKWYKGLTGGERVSGPMTVFDRTLYFATYKPSVPGGAAVCTEGGVPTLWGMDFFNADAAGIDKGGAPRWCKLGSVDPITGACLVALTQNEDPTLFDATLKGAIIPGVTIRAAQSCAQFDATPGDPAITALTSTKFDIFFGATSSRSGGATGTPQAARPETPLTRPLPRTTASIDAWALVVD